VGAPVRDMTLAIWAALAAALVGSAVAGRLGLAGLAPLGRVLRGARSTVLGRSALVICWAWLGWHAFAR